jgi:hypothetical protein
MMKEKKIRKERQQQLRITWKELYYMYKEDIHKGNPYSYKNTYCRHLALKLKAQNEVHSTGKITTSKCLQKQKHKIEYFCKN